MKQLFLFGASLVLLTSSCRKQKSDVKNLPPATQEGKNTFGFLLNGVPWTPQGIRGTANLSIDYDPGFKNGIFSIVAYNFIPRSSEQFIIGVRDSLNTINAPITLNLSQTSLYSVSFKKTCDYFSQLDDVSSAGSLTITKLDRTKGTISGAFNITLSKPGCETITITDGRFDMKF